MELLKFYINRVVKGFTLLEVLMAVTILASLTIFLSPIAIDFYNDRQFDTHLQNIVQSLRRAQVKSVVGEGESSFGVYFQPHYYVLFKGISYDGRDVSYDEIFELSNSISISGLSEVVFSRIKGIPSDTGNITLTANNNSGTININEIGKIDY